MLHAVAQSLTERVDPKLSLKLRQEMIRHVQKNGRYYAAVYNHELCLTIVGIFHITNPSKHILTTCQ